MSNPTDPVVVTAAILTHLLRSGHRADTLEVLTHGDGRGTVPPGTLEKAVAAALAEVMAENARLREALTPSGNTKAAYLGEFKMPVMLYDEDGEEYSHAFTVDWTAIKAIMAAVRARAALKGNAVAKPNGGTRAKQSTPAKGAARAIQRFSRTRPITSRSNHTSGFRASTQQPASLIGRCVRSAMPTIATGSFQHDGQALGLPEVRPGLWPGDAGLPPLQPRAGTGGAG